MTALCKSCGQPLPTTVEQLLGVPEAKSPLTKAEKHVMEALARRPGNLVTNEFLATVLDEVPRPQSFRDEVHTTQSVRDVIKRLRPKVPSLRIVTVYGLGYVLNPPGQK